MAVQDGAVPGVENVVLVVADSLNRHFLRCFGGTTEFDLPTPNIDRLAARSMLFDTHYAGSLPCMPARREFLAGVQEFPWRPWGPMEPFDTSLALAARRAGVLTQLVTDHYHYFQHGSGGYTDDYHGYEYIRGHEFDTWRTAPTDPDPVLLRQLLADEEERRDTFLSRAAYARNVAGFRGEEDFFPARVFRIASDWIAANAESKPWLLVVDSFDIHEPFHCPEPYASMFWGGDPRDPELTVWPRYGRIYAGGSALDERQLAFVRAQYAGKLVMWDRWFGTLLDALDRAGLWDSTMVVLTTDHGHYLGDHGWVGKPPAPVYDVLARTPLLISHPGAARGGHTQAVTSAVDLYATVLEALGADPSPGPHSRSLLPLLTGATDRHRDWALYGYWGCSANVTDGVHTYHRPYRIGGEAVCHSTMLINPWEWFTPVEIPDRVEAGRFLSHATSSVWRYRTPSRPTHERPMLFDLDSDPAQDDDLGGRSPEVERRMEALLLEALTDLGAPPEMRGQLGYE